jgi:5-methylcytosine-specific restriction endonuclease McrA
MPYAPMRLCRCGKKVPSGKMCACQIAKRAAFEKKRPSARQRGYDSKWEKARAAYLAKPENKYCACGCGRLADMIDHKVAPKGDMKLFWNVRNWQAYASICNKRKAIKYEGGFGNPIREYE